MGTEAETGVALLESKEGPKLEEARILRGVLEGSWPCEHLDSGLRASEEIYFKLGVCGNLPPP